MLVIQAVSFILSKGLLKQDVVYVYVFYDDLKTNKNIKFKAIPLCDWKLIFFFHFQEMCTTIGVDPLASSKGFWSEMLGVGDFYYELAVQVRFLKQF